jgi:hypothetical protein
LGARSVSLHTVEVMTAAIAPPTKEFSNGLENTDDH